MLELRLQRAGDTLTVSIAGQSSSVPLIDVVQRSETW